MSILFVLVWLIILHMFKLTSEADEMYKICSVIGTPDRDTWPDGLRLAESLNFQFPVCERANLFQLIPSASEEAVNLISVFLLFFSFIICCHAL
jgi:hypothetical protein